MGLTRQKILQSLYVIPLPQTSQSAAEILKSKGVKADIVHIDAAHDYKSVLDDAEAYWDLLNEGGCMIGDDYHPEWAGVVKAADEFSVKQGRELTVSRGKWAVTR